MKRTLSEWVYTQRTIREFRDMYGDALSTSDQAAISAMLRLGHTVEQSLVKRGVSEAFMPIMAAIESCPIGGGCDAGIDQEVARS